MDTLLQKKLLNRLSRAEGQIRALRAFLEKDESQDCMKFITQVKAARSALKGVSEEYIIHHIHTCEALPKNKRDTQISEAIKLLAKD